MVAAEPSSADHQAIAQLVRGASAFGLKLEGASIVRFQTYLGILSLWRTRLSLTAASTAREIVGRHIIDSFSIMRFVKPGFYTADIGSGAGFPGIPIAIACPEARVVLVESRRKRANFLREVIRTANLTNAEVIEARAESIVADRPATFDLVVARALGPVTDFLRLGTDLLKIGGLAIAMKGPKGHADAEPHPGFAPPEIVPYIIAGDVSRLLLIFRRR